MHPGSIFAFNLLVEKKRQKKEEVQMGVCSKYKGGRPTKYAHLDEWLDDMECERILDGLCLANTVNISALVFLRQRSVERYTAECRALKFMENYYASLLPGNAAVKAPASACA